MIYEEAFNDTYLYINNKLVDYGGGNSVYLIYQLINELNKLGTLISINTYKLNIPTLWSNTGEEEFVDPEEYWESIGGIPEVLTQEYINNWKYLRKEE
jgi:hypothetical protein